MNALSIMYHPILLPTEAEDVPVVITAPLHGNKKGQCDTGSDMSSYCCTMRGKREHVKYIINAVTLKLSS